MENDSKALDPYEAVIADLTSQREKIDQAIQLLQNLRGLGVPIPAGAGAAGGLGASEEKSAGLGPGAFLGMTIPDAAKKLLNHERRQMGNAEILAALRRGGLVLNSTDPLNTVGSVLNRRFKEVGDIVRVGRGTWGLKAWYPNRSFKVAAKGDDQPMIGKPAGVSFDFNDAAPQSPVADEENQRAYRELMGEDDDEEIPF